MGGASRRPSLPLDLWKSS